MTMRQRRRQHGFKRHYFTFLNGPYIMAIGNWTAAQAASFKRNPWQVFRKTNRLYGIGG